MYEKLYSLKQVSEMIPITHKTLYKWVCENKISYTKIGTRYFLSQGQLNALICIFTKDLTDTSR